MQQTSGGRLCAFPKRVAKTLVSLWFLPSAFVPRTMMEARFCVPYCSFLCSFLFVGYALTVAMAATPVATSVLFIGEVPRFWITIQDCLGNGAWLRHRSGKARLATTFSTNWAVVDFIVATLAVHSLYLAIIPAV